MTSCIKRLSDEIGEGHHILNQHTKSFIIKNLGFSIYLFRDFLSGEEISHVLPLIDRTSTPSTVFPPVSDPHYRNGSTSFLSYDDDDIISYVNKRICDLIGVSEEYGEPIQGQRYNAGQQFKAHTDYFSKNHESWPSQNRIGGQRVWSAIVCLQPSLKGGSTLFPQAGIRLHLKAGSLVIWCNLNADGIENEMSCHCGEPVEEGTKYIITKLLRERPYSVKG